VAGLAGLAGFLVRPDPHPGTVKPRLVVCDLFVAGLVASMLVSQQLNNDLRFLTPVDFTLTWALPYAVGRLFFRSPEDIGRLLPFAAGLTLYLTVYAGFEAVTHVNPVNRLLGYSDWILDESGAGVRWGLKRAVGPVGHPIALGMLLVLILPWAIEAWRKAGLREGPGWWRWLPAAVLAAIVCTVSRGALMAAGFVGYSAAYFARPKWRPVLTAVALLGGVVYFQYREEAIEMLGRMAGEKPNEDSVLIDGKEYPYSGTRHRSLLALAYRQSLDEAGLFGYGYHAKKADRDDIDQRFRSIDDHYLHFQLRFGMMGVGLFLAVAACTLLYLARSAYHTGAPEAGFAAALFGAVLGVTVMLQSVWFAPDFGRAWLFCAGMAASLESLRVGVPAKSAPSAEVMAASPPPAKMSRELPARWRTRWRPEGEGRGIA
jgi:hypothetical protein